MAKLAVIKAGGKQYLVKENDEIVVERLNEKGDVALKTLAILDDEGASIELGNPELSTQTKAKVLEDGKGEKIRVARFKSKVRYRKIRGFRPQLTKIKILSI